MASIFEIEKNVQEAIYMLEESEGEITPEIEEILNINKNELNDKINQYHYFISELESKNEAIAKEIERLGHKVNMNAVSIVRIGSFVNKAIKLYGVSNKKSTAKHKPLLVDTGLVKAVISYSEAVEINSKFIEVPDDLIPYAKRELKVIIPFKDFEKIFEEIKKVENTDVRIVNSTSISKTAIKEQMDLGVKFENASIIINEKTTFK